MKPYSRRRSPADVVFENEHGLAFHDNAPRSEAHVLIIPNRRRVCGLTSSRRMHLVNARPDFSPAFAPAG